MLRGVKRMGEVSLVYLRELDWQESGNRCPAVCTVEGDVIWGCDEV